ncbi:MULTISPECIES: hypothetical protein [unclassified Saccharibacter]|uniref:hypothetical protein n=1 Tax=unclassified Saccharibacter TaxID=2648722 RepID=UPI0019282DA1|nr:MULTISPECIES: hypothetical protein [unclassified Saccharibacter]
MCADLPPLTPISGRKQPVIALIGCDGSGKSTVGSVLLEEMSKQRPTAFCHLGKQAGNLERALGPVPFIGSLVSKKAKSENKRIQTGKKATSVAIITGFILSMRRVVRFSKMRWWHRRGYAILTDRYPQNSLPGPMDGPTVANLNFTQHWAGLLSRFERVFYARMARFKPDLVIRLHVDIETALQRKPDHVRFKLERKISDLPKLSFNGAPILELDSTQPLETVLTHAKEAVDQVLSLYPAPESQREGVLVSLVGCDGSGKSSLSADLVKCLGRMRPTLYGYLGLGSGDLGRRIGTWPLIGPWLEGKLTKKAKKTRTKGEKIPGLITALVVFGFSLLRYKRFLHVKKAVEHGHFVITDRYPQDEIPGQCDGPGLSAAQTNNPIIRLLARIERRLYQKIAAYRPDLVVVLDVDVDTALSRKPDHDRDALQTKIELMPQLTFGGAECVHVDARQAYLAVKEDIVAQLRKKRLI